MDTDKYQSPRVEQVFLVTESFLCISSVSEVESEMEFLTWEYDNEIQGW